MSSERLSMNPIARVKRFVSRAGSPRGVVGALGEEVLVRAWSHEWIRKILRPVFPKRRPEKWVFLVGCYNSGTTLLQHILSSHRDIAGLPREGVRFTDVLSNLEANGHHMMWDPDYKALRVPAMAPDAAYRRIVADWNPFWKPGASVFLDKSVANTARIKWLGETFPNALFIGIHRNGYCIAEGLHRRAMPPKHHQDKTGNPFYSLEETGRQWVWANEDMLTAFDGDPRCKLVSFEELVSQPDKVVADIFRFIGTGADKISMDGNCLHIGGKVFEIRNPNPSSLKRLSKDDIETLKAVIGPMMNRLGYKD